MKLDRIINGATSGSIRRWLIGRDGAEFFDLYMAADQIGPAELRDVADALSTSTRHLQQILRQHADDGF